MFRVLHNFALSNERKKGVDLRPLTC